LAAVLYDAVIIATSVSGERRIAATEFFKDAYVTALRAGEMVTGVEFSIPGPSSTGSFVEFAERRGDFATAAVGVALEFEGQTIAKAAVAIAGAERRAIRAPDVESFLVGKPLAAACAAEAGQKLEAAIDPAGDFLTSADFRKSLAGELTRRAIDAACAKALRQ
jgi:carbon-monoxide dehydrogenase medium subunit